RAAVRPDIYADRADGRLRADRRRAGRPDPGARQLRATGRREWRGARPGRGDRALAAAGAADPDAGLAPQPRPAGGALVGAVAGRIAAGRRWSLSRRQRGTLARALAMALYVVVTCFPFYWMFVTAFKRNPDLYELKNNPLIFNQPPTIDHLVYLFKFTNF